MSQNKPHVIEELIDRLTAKDTEIEELRSQLEIAQGKTPGQMGLEIVRLEKQLGLTVKEQDMKKITLKTYGKSVFAEFPDATDLDEVLYTVAGLIKALGYCFNGHLDIVEDEKED